ncbi:hypothetical protein [Adhaeretor mobilis]|uniref:Uncharacterized protein n=1 Tax=Adhaeretor mobilis TaxID=1930276 RepID=A0A517N1Q1_9BACT|nr:hypothetical protein [Adhaeretor mobilis]QDT01064.1 hypothetical protein HG15A2_44060 [Adhaeretor mobilis]
MTAQVLHKLEDMTHTIALWTSVAATTIFASVFFFTSDINFNYHFQRFFSGKAGSADLPIFMGILLAICLGYTLASKKQLAEVGGAIVVVSVAALYGWCAFVISYSPGPTLLVLAAPALFFLASRRAAAKQEALSLAEELPLVENHNDNEDHDNHHEPAEVVHEERELVAGAVA